MAKPVTKASWIGRRRRIAWPGHRRSLPYRPFRAARARSPELAVGPARCALGRERSHDGRQSPRPSAKRSATPTAPKSFRCLPRAKRPIIFAGPQLSNAAGRDLLADVEAATGVPAVILESPRGLADATLGALPDLAKQADLVLLLGKALDFTLKWTSAPSFDPAVRLIAIDPEAELTDASQARERRCAALRLRRRSGARRRKACGRRQEGAAAR